MKTLLARCRPLYEKPKFRGLLVLNVLLGLSYSFVGPFFSMFGTIEVKMKPMLFGVFMTINALSAIAIGTILAHASDSKFSRRTMLLLGSVFGVVGYFEYAYVRDFTALLLIGSLLLGVSSITFSQLFAHARETLSESGLPPEQGAFYMNAFRMYYALAWTAGPAIGSWVMVAFSFKGLFLCASAGFVLFTAAVWFLVPGTEVSREVKVRSSASLIALLARRDVLAHFVGFVLVFAASTIGMMALPLLVLNVLNGNEKNVGIIYSIAPVFELPFMLYFGHLATKRDPAKVIQIGVVIAIVYYVLLTFVRSAWDVYPLQVLSAATTAVTAGVAITYFQSFLPNHPGSATNLYMNAWRMGSTLGYLIFGGLAERFGYRIVFVACAGFAVATLALLQVSPRPSLVELSGADRAD